MWLGITTRSFSAAMKGFTVHQFLHAQTLIERCRMATCGICSMPMYHFQQQDSTGVTEDPEGSELPDLSAARECAVQSARELLANALRFDASVPDGLCIVDQNGIELLTVYIADVLPNSLKMKRL